MLTELEQRPECNPEYVTLKVLGMAWLGWDMGNLTDLERIRRIELMEALYLYNVGGEQLFLPFYDETAKKHKGSKGVLVGILSQHVGIFSTQNVCALLQNGAVHRQRRQQNGLEMFIEKAAPNNELESFFSQVAIHGYKPRLMELQVCMSPHIIHFILILSALSSTLTLALILASGTHIQDRCCDADTA